MATQFISPKKRADETTVRPSPVCPSRGPAEELFFDLGQILERLWIFYEAMRRGTPVVNSDEVLSQMKLTLSRVSTHHSDRVDRKYESQPASGPSGSAIVR
jgi:hypothetical protein